MMIAVDRLGIKISRHGPQADDVASPGGNQDSYGGPSRISDQIDLTGSRFLTARGPKRRSGD